MKSPFLFIEDAISPSTCETLISNLGLKTPNKDSAGKNEKYERFLSPEQKLIISNRLSEHVPIIQHHFEQEITGITSYFQQYPECAEQPAEPIGIQGWKYSRKKYTKMESVDLIGILWLKDYYSQLPIDLTYEVYGGKLEFHSFNFSLAPTRGTLLVFPCTPNFINATSNILVGSLETIMLKIKTKQEVNIDYDVSRMHEWFV